MQPDLIPARSRGSDLDRQARAPAVSRQVRPGVTSSVFGPVWLGLAPLLAALVAIAQSARADGETPYWEKNVRLKIDSAKTGPPEGVPVVLGAGMRGDRVSVIFGSLAELEGFIDETC